jgi:hypothetical protein
LPDAGRIDVGNFGGPGRVRTDDLFHAMEARSQLRHRPTTGNSFRISRWLRLGPASIALNISSAAVPPETPVGIQYRPVTVRAFPLFSY